MIDACYKKPAGVSSTGKILGSENISDIFEISSENELLLF